MGTQARLALCLCFPVKHGVTVSIMVPSQTHSCGRVFGRMPYASFSLGSAASLKLERGSKALDVCARAWALDCGRFSCAPKPDATRGTQHTWRASPPSLLFVVSPLHRRIHTAPPHPHCTAASPLRPSRTLSVRSVLDVEVDIRARDEVEGEHRLDSDLPVGMPTEGKDGSLGHPRIATSSAQTWSRDGGSGKAEA